MRGGGEAAVGLAIFLNWLAQAILAVPSGYLSDKIGPRETTIIGAMIAARLFRPSTRARARHTTAIYLGLGFGLAIEGIVIENFGYPIAFQSSGPLTLTGLIGFGLPSSRMVRPVQQKIGQRVPALEDFL